RNPSSLLSLLLLKIRNPKEKRKRLKRRKFVSSTLLLNLIRFHRNPSPLLHRSILLPKIRNPKERELPFLLDLALQAPRREVLSKTRRKERSDPNVTPTSIMERTA
ncbi:hypothetical protein PFISCL1PPCAC_27665, partial [Pristionchus fissidentatus]